jgi:nitrite reductase (NO-forming)
MHRTRIRLLIAAGLMTVIAVGFFSAIGIFAQDATPAPAPARTTANTRTPSHSLAASGPTASPGNPSGPVIDLVDVAFHPKGFSLPANTPTVVTLVNRGAVVHNFTIDELNVRSGDLQPGQSTTVTVDAPAGVYTYYCAIPGHRAAGMVGTLTAT